MPLPRHQESPCYLGARFKIFEFRQPSRDLDQTRTRKFLRLQRTPAAGAPLPRIRRAPSFRFAENLHNVWHFMRPIAKVVRRGEVVVVAEVIMPNSSQIAAIENHGECPLPADPHRMRGFMELRRGKT